MRFRQVNLFSSRLKKAMVFLLVIGCLPLANLAVQGSHGQGSVLPDLSPRMRRVAGDSGRSDLKHSIDPGVRRPFLPARIGRSVWAGIQRGAREVGRRGNWALLLLPLALLLCLSVLFRKAAPGAPRGSEWDLFPPITDADMRVSGRPGHPFSVFLRGAGRGWVLIQRMGNVSRLVAELRAGTVVRGSLLGQSPDQRYKLTTNQEWFPTEEPEHLVLDIKEGFGKRQVS